MLSRFKIKNFRSIREIDLDLSYGEGKAPNGYLQSESLFFHEASKNKRLVPCLALFGANALGKTNIIRAMDAFISVINHGVEKHRFEPNRLNPPSKSTTFCLDFYIDKNNFVYEIEYDADEIFSETLTRNGSLLFLVSPKNSRFEKLASKNYTKERLREIYDVECGSKTKKRLTFLSVIATRYEGLNEDLACVYKFFNEGLHVLPENNVHISTGIDFLAKIFAEGASNPTQEAFKTIIDVLKKLDIDIANIALKRNERVLHLDGENTSFIPGHTIGKIKIEKDKLTLSSDEVTTWHKDIHGNLVAFNFIREESSGTQILAGLLGILLKALHDGSTVMIDELDRSLHPFLLSSLVGLFKNKQRNTKGAQLIFTVHDIYILERQKLRMSEIGIIEKTLKSGTTVKRLCEDKSLRNVSNFKQLYLDGVYGGIPFPYL